MRITSFGGAAAEDAHKMRLSKQSLVVIGILIVIFLVYCLGPIMSLRTLSTFKYDPAVRETHVAYIYNYKIHTTPLPVETVQDICQKLGIKESSEQCGETVTTYAPELFDEIKEYFRNIPEQDRTYDLVQSKLGEYLDYCKNPASDGHYRCIYDLNGDNLYPIGFYFDKDGFYYDVIANATGIFSD